MDHGGILIDTGSVGLRVLSSVVTLPLPQQTGAAGAPVVECLPFVDGFTWGPVQTADVFGLFLLEDLAFRLEPVLQVVTPLTPSFFVKIVGALRDPSL